MRPTLHRIIQFIVMILLLTSCTGSMYAVVPSQVYQGYVEQGGQVVITSNLRSTTLVQQSFPGARIDVYDQGTLTPSTIYADGIGTPLGNPFYANADGSFRFFSNAGSHDIKFSGGGLAAPITKTVSGFIAPGMSYITQAMGDLRYLQLTGGSLAGPGNLTVGGTLTSTGDTTLNGAANSIVGVTTMPNTAPYPLRIERAGEQNLYIKSTNATTADRVFLGIGRGASYPAGTADWRLGMLDGAHDFVLWDAKNSRFPLKSDFSTGLITLCCGLTVSSGTTTVGAVTAGAIGATSVASSGAVSGTAGNFSGNVSGVSGIFSGNVSGAAGNFTGTVAGNALTSATTLNVTGLSTLTGGLTTSNGNGNFGTGTVTGGIGNFSGDATGATDFKVEGTDAVNQFAILLRNKSAVVGLGTDLQIKTDASDVATVHWTTAVQNWLAGVNGGTARDWELRNLTVSAVPISVSGTTNNVTSTSNWGIGQVAGSSRLIVGAGGTGGTAEGVVIDAGSAVGGTPSLKLQRNGSNKATLGISSNTNDIITGAAANDLSVMNGQKINFAANGSGAIQMSLNTSGYLGLGSATASFPLHVVNTGAAQMVAEYDGTHRSYLSHDATFGNVGTSTATSFRILTNSVVAATFDTSQNVNFAGAVGLNDSSATYPFSVKKNGASMSAGSWYSAATITDATAAAGVHLGYQSGLAGGAVIASYGTTAAGSSLTFKTANLFTGAYSDVLVLGPASGSNTGISIPGGVIAYQGVTLAGYGIPTQVATTAYTLQTASIGTTTIYTPASTVQHRLCWNQLIQRAATTSSSLLTTVGWNNGAAKTSTFWIDPAGGTTGTTADTSNALGSERGNCMTFLPTSGQPVTIATTYSTTGGTTMQYALYVTIEKIGQ